MKHRMIALTIAVVLSLIATFPAAKAQTPKIQEITYGQTLKGEITNDTFESKYKFKGKADEIVVILVDGDKDAKFDQQLHSPEFTVVRNNKKLIDTDNLLHIFGATAAMDLQADGDYIVTVTRDKGKDGKDVGKYSIYVVKLDVLEPDKTITGRVNAERPQFYAIRSDVDFSITYERVTGNFRPEIRLYALKNDGGLDIAALVTGKALSLGTVNITPEEAQPYILQIASGLYSSGYGKDEAQYKITMGQVSDK